MDNEVYLYCVNPKKVITGVSGVNAIRVPKSLYLTKEDVYTCLKSASVYRRFAAEGINERVTVFDVDRVHRDHYISPEDWEKMKAEEKGKNRGLVSTPDIDTTVKEEKVEEPIVETLDTSTEDKVEEKPVEQKQGYQKQYNTYSNNHNNKKNKHNRDYNNPNYNRQSNVQTLTSDQKQTEATDPQTSENKESETND